MNRRELLQLTGLGAAAGLSAACDRLFPPNTQPTATPTAAPRPTEVPTQAATAVPTATSVRAAEQPTPTPRPTEIPMAERGGIRVFGVPDRATSVDIARGEFKNTLGLGTEAFVAEPGGLLVGPDFFDRQGNNPLGRNQRGADTLYESKGHIKPFSAVTQEVIRWPGVAVQNLPEGGFVFVSAGQAVVEIVDGAEKVRARFELPHKGGNHNWFFIVRGLYPEQAPLQQNTNRNLSVRLVGQDRHPNGYIPGHAYIDMYEAGDNTNTAFVSEGQFLQKVQTSESSGTNCGAGGCSNLTAVMYDVNTGAFAEVEHSGDRNSDPRQNWRSIEKNF